MSSSGVSGLVKKFNMQLDMDEVEESEGWTPSQEEEFDEVESITPPPTSKGMHAAKKKTSKAAAVHDGEEKRARYDSAHHIVNAVNTLAAELGEDHVEVAMKYVVRFNKNTKNERTVEVVCGKVRTMDVKDSIAVKPEDLKDAYEKLVASNAVSHTFRGERKRDIAKQLINSADSAHESFRTQEGFRELHKATMTEFTRIQSADETAGMENTDRFLTRSMTKQVNAYLERSERALGLDRE